MKFKSDCKNEVQYFQIQKYFTALCPVFSVAVIFSTCAGLVHILNLVPLSDVLTGIFDSFFLTTTRICGNLTALFKRELHLLLKKHVKLQSVFIHIYFKSSLTRTKFNYIYGIFRGLIDNDTSIGFRSEAEKLLTGLSNLVYYHF